MLCFSDASVREDLRKVSQLHFRSMLEVMESGQRSKGQLLTEIDPARSLPVATSRQSALSQLYTAQSPYQS
jgi:hypothetical protein